MKMNNIDVGALLKSYKLSSIDYGEFKYKFNRPSTTTNALYVFADVRMLPDHNNTLKTFIVLCSHRLVLEADFINHVRDCVIEKYQKIKTFNEDDKGWCYHEDIDALVEQKITTAIRDGIVKCFNPSMNMPEEYITTNDSMFSLIPSKKLYEGRINTQTIH